MAVPSRASMVFLVAGGIAIAVYFALPPDAQDVLYVVIGIAGVSAVVVAASRMRHAARLAWNLFAVGLLCSVIADALSGWDEMVNNREPQVPSVVDGFYLAAYPILAAGIFLLLRELGALRTRIAMLDAVIVTIAAATVQWVFFIDPYLHSSLGVSERLVGMAYPTGDLLLFVALAQLLLAVGGRVAAFQLLVASMFLWVIGDEIFGLSVDNYAAGGWVDVFWLGSYIFWGSAALDPSSGRPLFRDRRDVPRLTNARLVFLGGALLTIPVVILTEHYWPGHTLHPTSIAVGATVLSVLVVVRFAGLVRAVERARIAERAANTRLRELDRLKDEFVSTVSHELRTPLTSISGYVELARERADTEGRGYLDIVERNAARLLSLVNDLLFVARIQSGGVELFLEDVDAAELAAECVSSAEPHASGNGIMLRLRTTGGSALVHADRRRLGQVLDNLVSNAIKFSPEGGEVDLSVASADGVVQIEVADRGIGIPDDERARLFERFFRSSFALGQQIPGTGLGLYISKAIVEAHGGQISADTTAGQGSVFMIELPVAGAAA